MTSEEILGGPHPPNPKRTSAEGRKRRLPPRFPANFSPEFASWAIGRFSETGDTVFDPFCGSASTLISARILGRRACGVELNPAWVVYGRARAFASVDSIVDARVVAVELAKQSEQIRLEDCAGVFKQALSKAVSRETIPATIVAAALLAGATEKSVTKRLMNHSWKILEAPVPEAVPLTLVLELMDELCVAVAAIPLLPEGAIELRWGDSTIPSFGGDAALILTSPPYLSRLDYAMGSRVELEVLRAVGVQFALEDLRRGQIGSLLTRASKSPYEPFPRECQRIVERVANHPSKGSRGYYAAYVRDYLEKTRAWLSATSSIAKPGDWMVMVLQDSWYKESHLPTADLVASLAADLGWQEAQRWDFPSRKHIGHINVDAAKWRKNSIIVESVMSLNRCTN